MKICYLANAQSIHTQRWAKHFSSQGHDVTVISFDLAEIEGTKVIVLRRRIQNRRLNILLSISKVCRLVDDIRPDILHAHYVTSYGFVGALTGKHPYVATAWGTDVLIEPERSFLYRQIVRFALGRGDLITTTAPNATDLITRRKYTSSDKIITFPFGIDTNHFNPDVRTHKHGDNPPLVISIRRLDYDSDIEVFVMAIPKVISHFPDVRFVIASDGPLRSKMEGLARDSAIEKYLTFEGEIPHHRVPVLLGKADIYVSTYPSDTNHVSLNEAMACGAFPVVPDIPANRVWIEPGENGMLYPSRDVDQLAERIIEALRHPDWRQAVMPRNWDIIRTKASWSNNMKIMMEHYERLVFENHGRKVS
jgi:glycosyltransferase involved in cell wall biosynthesis